MKTSYKVGKTKVASLKQLLKWLRRMKKGS
jgi:hypothetical protein